jgi:uncharacterized protein YrrD
MLRSVRQTKGFTLGAKDGRIGHVQEFYFDDHDWTIRYLVALAGNWLTGRMVLLSPHVVEKPLDEKKLIPVELTRDQVRKSPSPETDRPVSRQFEMDYYRYFGWPYYWSGPYLWGPTPFPALPTSSVDAGIPPPSNETANRPKGDPHLRSTDEVTGYHIRARDGEIGHVEDFLFDDRNWSIRYLVVDTRNWWPGKKVLIPPAWIGEIHWEDRSVETEVVRQDISQAPAYDPGEPMTAAFEEQLQHYYESDLHKV